jgi:hypothetical protein
MLLTTMLVVYVLYAISYDGEIASVHIQDKILVVGHNRDLINLDLGTTDDKPIAVQSVFTGNYSTTLDVPVTWLDMVSPDAYLNINPRMCLGLWADYPIPPKRLYTHFR